MVLWFSSFHLVMVQFYLQFLLLEWEVKVWLNLLRWNLAWKSYLIMEQLHQVESEKSVEMKKLQDAAAAIVFKNKHFFDRTHTVIDTDQANNNSLSPQFKWKWPPSICWSVWWSWGISKGHWSWFEFRFSLCFLQFGHNDFKPFFTCPKWKPDKAGDFWWMHCSDQWKQNVKMRMSIFLTWLKKIWKRRADLIILQMMLSFMLLTITKIPLKVNI